VSATDLTARSAAEVLDPAVRRFVTEVNAAYARIEGFSDLPPPDKRRAAEAVRAPWRSGGPVMAGTRESRVPVTGGTLRVRIHDPGPPGPKPALIYLHGGGWMLFSLDTHDRVMREYAARAGVIVVGVDYPLAPEVRFPVALHQVADLVRWLALHGAEVGVDGGRLAIGGDSAGGNLAIATSILLRDAGEPQRLAALLLNYSVFETDCSTASATAWGGDGFMLTQDELRMFVRNYLRTADDARDPLACPALAQLEGLPPCCLTIAQCDVLAEQNVAMHGRLAAAGVAARAVIYPGATHSFLEAVSIAPLADRALQCGSKWLQDVLGGRRPATGLSVAPI